MSSSVTKAIALVIAGLLLATGAGAGQTGGSAQADAADDLQLRYGLTLAGVPVAKLALRHDLDGDRYRSRLVIDTIGLAGRLTGYHGKLGAVGRLDDDGGLVPASFRARSETRKKTRTIAVRFDPTSGDVIGLEITKRGQPDGSDVPEALQKEVADPLSSFMRLRDHIATARTADLSSAGTFAAQVFDGRKRTDVEARLLGRDRATIAGRDWPVLRVELILRPLAGYNDNDLNNAGNLDAYHLELLLSDDDRLLPLRLQTIDWLIPATIELLEDCTTPTGCRLAAR